MSVNAHRLAYYVEQAGFSVPAQVEKRNGSRVAFDVNRIESAVARCFAELETHPKISSAEVAEGVVRALSVRYSEGAVPNVEDVQNAVEFALYSSGEFEAAKRYILYRDQHAQERKSRDVPQEIKDVFAADKEFLLSPSQQFNFYDKYSRYNWDLGRRETWIETVDRTVAHLRWEVDQHKPGAIPDEVFDRIHDAILHQRVMPSMRLLAMAGEAAQRNSMSLYNCSYLPVKDIDAFVEAMLISMAGCGVGFSVEREYVEQFPRIKRQKRGEVETHYVDDSTEGWANALRLGLETWWDGGDVKFDFSMIRPAGAPLKTKGGRASGPEPLQRMLDFLRSTIIGRQGSYLRTTDAHLMMCAVGEAAVQGGVRRTAMISLFDWDDHEMRNIKNGGANMNPLLWNANNSAVWPEDVTDLDIMEQMLEMVRGKSGEPGIFSRTNALKRKPKHRKRAKFGTNPCGEIVLRPYGFCNLTQAVSREGDTEEDLAEKVELATIIGTIQSLSTRFPGLRDEWKANAEEERLLGVDLTAQMECELLRFATPEGAELRERLYQHAVNVNKVWASALGIAQSAAISCNKPAGNSAEFLGESTPNGIHAYHAPFYLRRMTVSATSPLLKVLQAAGAPLEPRSGSTAENATQWIATFPKRAPEGAPTKGGRSAVEQLEFWLLNKEHWTDHNPSCTIDYSDDEVVEMIAWVVKHKDRIGGLSFFPRSDFVYAQAPFEEITEEQYDAAKVEFPELDFSQIYRYELDDMTTAAQELACFAGQCEV